MIRYSTRQPGCPTTHGKFRAPLRLVLAPPSPKAGTSNGRMTNWPTFLPVVQPQRPFPSRFHPMLLPISTATASPSGPPTATSPRQPSSSWRLKPNPLQVLHSFARAMSSSRVQVPQPGCRSPTPEMPLSTSTGRWTFHPLQAQRLAPLRLVSPQTLALAARCGRRSGGDGRCR